MPEVEHYDRENMGDQFDANMKMQQDPWNLGCMYDKKQDVVFVRQTGSGATIALPNPEACRAFAGIMLKTAERLERGEL